jgi:ABC-type transport system substrate-binding protein
MGFFSFRQVPIRPRWIPLLGWSGLGLALTCPVHSQELRPLRILQDQPPASLNPRSTTDANGQRLLALLFGGLTRLDSELQPVASHAESWTFKPLNDKNLAPSEAKWRWSFRLQRELKDHAGMPITATHWVQCLENYRSGKPTSPLKSAFPNWLGTRLGTGENEIELLLSAPDPYLPRNLSALRFFRAKTKSGRTEPNPGPPCQEPQADQELVTSGRYSLQWPKFLEDPMTLTPQPELRSLGYPPLRFDWVQDDHTRLLKLLRKESDLSLATLSLSKTEWLRENAPEAFSAIDRVSTRVSYLAFHQQHPILKDLRVRKALAMSIPRQEIIDHKFYGHCTLASSLLSPLLPEATTVDFAYDPKSAARLLDEAGYLPNSKGIRFSLRYKTTPVREGLETALIFQDAWKKIGVQLDLDVVEPAVLLQAARKGDFEIYSSRWLGVADGSILFRTLRSGHPDNRVKYSNAEVDQWLDVAMQETDSKLRTALLRKVQIKMMEDLPYFPLWYWNNTLIYEKNLKLPNPFQFSLSGSFESFIGIRRL